jgi:prophage regulatory protein
MKLLSYEELRGKGIRWSKPHLWRKEKAGKFVKRVPYGERSHGWPEDEVDAFLAACAAEREGGR